MTRNIVLKLYALDGWLLFWDMKIFDGFPFVSVGLDDDLLDFSKKKKKKKKAFDLTDMDDALPVSMRLS